MDAEVLGTIYPLTIAYLSSAPSRWLCEWMSAFTQRVLVCPDNDEAGLDNFDKTIKRFGRFQVKATQLRVPKTLKDAGDIARLDVEGNPFEEYYNQLKNNITAHLG